MSLLETLRDFMETPAPSGYEREMAYKLRDALAPYCDEVSLDRPGNCIGKIAGTNGAALPRAMVFAHVDSLGFIVRKVEETGYLQMDRLGGVPEKVLPGTSLLIRDEEGGWHPGVFAVKSHHATAAEDKYKVDPITAMVVDIGVRSADEARALGIEIGCPAVYKPAFTALPGGRVTGTFLDNRGGCATLVDIARRLRERRPACDVYLVGTVWEEFNLRGAMLAARTVAPDLAISLDVTLAGDTPDLAARYSDTLGQGACVQLYSFHGRGTLNGTLPHEPMFKLAKRAAQSAGLPLQRFATVGMLTDASYLQLEGQGVACLEMGFPTRYTHTPVELSDTADLAALAAIVAEMLRGVDAGFQLARY